MNPIWVKLNPYIKIVQEFEHLNGFKYILNNTIL